MRVFFAINLPSVIKKQTADCARDLYKFLPDSKPVQPENFHITLHFVGETDNDGILRLRNAAEECAEKFRGQRIIAQLNGFGAFKNGKDNLIYAGVNVQPHDIMSKINGELVNSIRKYDAGAENSKQKFTPHVTVFRKTNFAGTNKNILRDMDFSTSKFLVTGFSLMESLSIPLFDRAGGYKGMGIVYKSVFDILF